MNNIYIGKLVNTHGLKGEVKIISDFKYKEDVFKINNKIYINDIEYIIKSYRKHKMFDMVTLSNINSIDDALNIKGSNVYINREDYNFNGYLDEDLIGLDVYGIDFIGKVDSIINNNAHELIVVTNEDKTHYVPYIDEFIEKIDLENKRIDIKEIEGLINEN